ncbi:tRNA glutamyl-Q(34) synthetase GluQRS [Thalassotalea sp. PLHSN55]|uniref:tRNA glutamyl-Q(34) synthetase GluQRS n=1 Tax=Thalassotalea sp. PLHSN55 TaxID=3435888 RepID=UPI003F879CBD
MKFSLSQRPLSQYRGRFAPSPSGLLHFGSLVAALASYLDAKHHHGRWLVRIEDIDPPREQAGASQQILATLDAFGLHWDEQVLYQSQQSELYLDVLSDLKKHQLSYCCQCTRAQIKAIGGIYQGHCRSLNLDRNKSAIRVINKHGIYQYQDVIQGQVSCNQALAQEDFIVFRKDGLFAYQLACVVDDIFQGISHVIRGFDLLEPTARQLSFFQILACQAPQYGHIPLAVTEEGYKLSKQNKAPAINNEKPQPALIAALNFLGQSPDSELALASVNEIITWAVQNWQRENVPKVAEIAL